MRTSEIKFSVTLDEKNIPAGIIWQADESGIEGEKSCKSIMLSVWDSAEAGTLRIDLWTKQMPVDEMKRFFYETFFSMADTYQRATGEKEAASGIREFANSFGKSAGILK